MALTDAQKERIKAAPDGQKFLLGDVTYVKQGDQLVKSTPSIASEVGGGLYEGAKETVEGIPAMVQGALGLPSAAYAAAQRVAADPRTEIPALAKGAAQTALGMVPETFRYANPLLHIASTQLGLPARKPTPRSVARDVGSVGTSQLLGAAVPKLVRGIRRLPAKFPGAAVALNEMAAEESAAIPAALKSTGATDAAYAEAAARGANTPRLRMNELRRTASGILRDEQALANPRQTVVTAMKNFLQDSRQGWDYSKYKAEIERMGAILGGTSGEEGLSRAHALEVKRLLHAMHTDIEKGLVSQQVRAAVPPSRSYVGGQWVTTPAQPAQFRAAPPTAGTLGTAEAYAAARKTARRAFAVDELETMITKARSTVGDQHLSWNTNSILKSIDQAIEKAANPGAPGHKKALRFVGSWEPGELLTIRSRLAEIGRDLPKIPVGKGVPHGSGGYLARAMIGELIGGALGFPAAGTAAGVLAPSIVAKAMMSKSGRAAVRAASKVDPKIGPVFQNTLAGLLRSQAPENQPTGGQ